MSPRLYLLFLFTALTTLLRAHDTPSPSTPTTDRLKVLVFSATTSSKASAGPRQQSSPVAVQLGPPPSLPTSVV
ncbi:hypothetical protein [Prosthecobacter sp.]|uniref:hypothetical protein n=1 Tax=Prosthecobacter sp. TaxID=1965333 RepID=UPI0037841776